MFSDMQNELQECGVLDGTNELHQVMHSKFPLAALFLFFTKIGKASYEESLIGEDACSRPIVIYFVFVPPFVFSSRRWLHFCCQLI